MNSVNTHDEYFHYDSLEQVCGNISQKHLCKSALRQTSDELADCLLLVVHLPLDANSCNTV